MADIIRLLPDSVANQIAAGEVIQRPASVIKELMENAVDAGAGRITVNVKDAGRTLIQVMDNGCGMSETDARLCWERHSTSKIRDANDLFAIKTKGFRGEALASIAAIAEVSLRTRRLEDELGTHIRINASKTEYNEPVSCEAGSNFQVKNLFYNIPARRKFLKSDSVELKNIISEFNHIALAHPEIEFSLLHNNSQIYNLTVNNLKQRIVQVFGKHLVQSLVPVNADTSIIKITGFIGKPEFARKTFGEQFFFVNKRFIRHNYYHKAVIKAYEMILPPEYLPSYFIYLESDPRNIDINIHPTKTEIKFEDEKAIWQILHAVVKESIGKFNLTPSLDFEMDNRIRIPVLSGNTEVPSLTTHINPDYNPFKEDDDRRKGDGVFRSGRQESLKNWEVLFAGDGLSSGNEGQASNIAVETIRLLQLKSMFIIAPVKSGLMLIDQKRAYERVVFERLINRDGPFQGVAQQTLFPETVELNAEDYVTYNEISDSLQHAGFDIRDAGNNCIIIYGIPSTVKNSGLKALIEEILESYKNYSADVSLTLFEKLALSISKASSRSYGKVLEQEEMRELVDQLFGCSNPNYSPSGKPVLRILNIEEIEKLLNIS